MKITTICRIFFLLAILTAKAQAYTAADYYNAGLQLYNAKNYPQATQYFTAALSLDPNNAAALQGRANCYYAQGQYQQALTDYQKVLSLNPSNAQLSQFVQALQAKVGASPAAAAPASTAPPERLLRLPAPLLTKGCPCTNKGNMPPPFLIFKRPSRKIPTTRRPITIWAPAR